MHTQMRDQNGGDMEAADLQAVRDELLAQWYENSRNSSFTFDQFASEFTGFDVSVLKALSS